MAPGQRMRRSSGSCSARGSFDAGLRAARPGDRRRRDRLGLQRHHRRNRPPRLRHHHDGAAHRDGPRRRAHRRDKGQTALLAQLGAIVGDTDTKQARSHAEPNIDTSGVDPFDCGAAVLVAPGGGYYQKARQAMIGDTDRGARGWVAAQVISVFAGRADTVAFLDAMAADWSSCIRKGAITMTGPPDQHWTPGPLERGDARIAMTVTRADPPPPRSCHHVLAAQANVVVDALVCGAGDTVAPANQLVAALLAKFPT